MRWIITENVVSSECLLSFVTVSAELLFLEMPWVWHFGSRLVFSYISVLVEEWHIAPHSPCKLSVYGSLVLTISAELCKWNF